MQCDYIIQLIQKIVTDFPVAMRRQRGHRPHVQNVYGTFDTRQCVFQEAPLEHTQPIITFKF